MSLQEQWEDRMLEDEEKRLGDEEESEDFNEPEPTEEPQGWEP